MRFHPPEVIAKSLSLLNSSGIDWILLRNTNNELPDYLELKKDIDILVRPENKENMHAFLLANRFSEIQHPYSNDVRFYGVDAFRKYKNQEGLLIDINFQAVVRSLDKGQWIPLDQAIQKELWASKRSVSVGAVQVMMPGAEDFFVLTLARCVFDKKDFTDWHRDLLSQTVEECDIELLSKKFDLIFFKFAPRLMDLVKFSDFDEIIPSYLSFSDY